jgi:hypothetical protein
VSRQPASHNENKGCGATVVDRVIERTLAIQEGAHQAALLPVEVFDTAAALGELGLVGGLACALWKEQG